MVSEGRARNFFVGGEAMDEVLACGERSEEQGRVALDLGNLIVLRPFSPCALPKKIQEQIWEIW